MIDFFQVLMYMERDFLVFSARLEESLIMADELGPFV